MLSIILKDAIIAWPDNKNKSLLQGFIKQCEKKRQYDIDFFECIAFFYHHFFTKKEFRNTFPDFSRLIQDDANFQHVFHKNQKNKCYGICFALDLLHDNKLLTKENMSGITAKNGGKFSVEMDDALYLLSERGQLNQKNLNVLMRMDKRYVNNAALVLLASDAAGMLTDDMRKKIVSAENPIYFDAMLCCVQYLKAYKLFSSKIKTLLNIYADSHNCKPLAFYLSALESRELLNQYNVIAFMSSRSTALYQELLGYSDDSVMMNQCLDRYFAIEPKSLYGSSALFAPKQTVSKAEPTHKALAM